MSLQIDTLALHGLRQAKHRGVSECEVFISETRFTHYTFRKNTWFVRSGRELGCGVVVQVGSSRGASATTVSELRDVEVCISQALDAARTSTPATRYPLSSPTTHRFFEDIYDPKLVNALDETLPPLLEPFTKHDVVLDTIVFDYRFHITNTNDVSVGASGTLLWLQARKEASPVAFEIALRRMDEHQVTQLLETIQDLPPLHTPELTEEPRIAFSPLSILQIVEAFLSHPPQGIPSPAVSVVDDPGLPPALRTASIDDAGAPQRRCVLWSKDQELQPPSHRFRRELRDWHHAYRRLPRTLPSNLVVEEGSDSYEAVVNDADVLVLSILSLWRSNGTTFTAYVICRTRNACFPALVRGDLAKLFSEDATISKERIPTSHGLSPAICVPSGTVRVVV